MLRIIFVSTHNIRVEQSILYWVHVTVSNTNTLGKTITLSSRMTIALFPYRFHSLNVFLLSFFLLFIRFSYFVYVSKIRLLILSEAIVYSFGQFGKCQLLSPESDSDDKKSESYKKLWFAMVFVCIIWEWTFGGQMFNVSMAGWLLTLCP